MVWLYLGVFLFMMVHFVPGLAPGSRKVMIERVGENPYKGIFSLVLLAAIVLMVVGWRSAIPQLVYIPPSWGTPLASVLMLISVMLFGAARFKQCLPHSCNHSRCGLLSLFQRLSVASLRSTNTCPNFGASTCPSQKSRLIAPP